MGMPKHYTNMRSPTPSTAPCLPTWQTQQSFQPSRVRFPPPLSTASTYPHTRSSPRIASTSLHSTPRTSPDRSDTMPGPIRTSHERVDSERYNPIAQAQPAASSSSNADKGKKQPPRPLNAWIIYRREKFASLTADKKIGGDGKPKPQAEISKIISEEWRNENADVRQHFEHLANLAKAEHQKIYPEYQFRPQKRVDKEREKEEKRQEKERDKEAAKRAKQVQQQMRSGQAPVPPHMLLAVPGMPISGSVMPPGMLIGPNGVPYAGAPQLRPGADFNDLMQMRFGPGGPTPPLSQCPSPNGSPAMSDNASLSASPSAPSVAIAPASSQSRRTTPDAPSRSTSVAAPRPVVAFRPPSVSGWQNGVANAQNTSRPPSTAQPNINDASTWWQSSQSSSQPNQQQSDEPSDDALLNAWVNPEFTQEQQDALASMSINVCYIFNYSIVSIAYCL